ncbi:hypothetical protein BDV95DRAFT_607554 [Massariosphaeria phaeospora]|uniref:Uncharacterized protein n=1 Tax=Massariosphaeria phaeospora TaxID=100035 RepID=A0A7C8I5H0_9PLEO|nr:hypothetical protein BDV95DRAFT_607554 [Massariosphaeria phaeospora]
MDRFNGGGAQVARSSFPDSVVVESKTSWAKTYLPSLSSAALSWRKAPHERSPRRWKPRSLRASVLIPTILFCWALIITLQLLLTRSQRDGGIIFAEKISALPLRQTFLHTYFPTIIAVVFSIFWAWIDLETKRLEPYYQLSKEDGALGKDSLLLRYPFDFIPLVPVRAFRQRHWAVFWASFAVILVTWGIVPTQSAIFSTERITRTSPSTFSVSTGYIPAEKQESVLTLQYAHSTYAIVALNETLPPFMTWNYTLAPFKPRNGTADKQVQGSGTWTAPTMLYSLDLSCEEAHQEPYLKTHTLGILYNNTAGCSWSQGLDGNLTMDEQQLYNSTKEFSGMYAGYWNPDGFALYALQGFCPVEANHTFYAAFQRNKKKEDPPNKVTAIFCTPKYYAQKVNATVDIVTGRPQEVVALSAKEPLSPEIFNTTWLETQMSSGASSQEVRGNGLPTVSAPNYNERLMNSNITLVPLERMTGLAIQASKRETADFLDPKTLREGYEIAYRLLFARAMVDVLNPDLGPTDQVVGTTQMHTETVAVESIFTYIVEGLLGVISIAAMFLLYFSISRPGNLGSDPSTIASIMSIVADNKALLSELENLDCCTMEEVEQALSHKRFKLLNDEHGVRITKVDRVIDASTDIEPLQPRNMEIAKPVRPVELSLPVAVPFVGLFVLLAVGLGVLFFKAELNGLPLPSKNRIVRSLVQNYIPTAIASLIEPMWILINRFLCMLQPLEELQGCNARAKRSIDLNYSSLPPQLVVLKAMKTRHFVLAAVCTMALLANLLAITFASMFHQDSVPIWTQTNFHPMLDLKFVSINGSEARAIKLNKNGEDQFVVAESNLSKGTPLSAWTDESMFYLPFTTVLDHEIGSSLEYRAETEAFGAELDCIKLESGVDYRAIREVDEFGRITMNLNTTVHENSGMVDCSGHTSIEVGPISESINQESRCQRGPSATEVLLFLDAPQNSTKEDQEICMGAVVLGWLRGRSGTCGVGDDSDLDGKNSLFVRCRPRLRKGRASVRVNSKGQLQDKVDHYVGDPDPNFRNGELLSNNPVNLIAYSNRYLFASVTPRWHNDSFPIDFFNHFVSKMSNDSQLLDPNQNFPSFETIQRQLNATYSKLFAIWLAVNKDTLLMVPEKHDEAPVVGWKGHMEERLFLSTLMFAIAEVIICTYAIVAIAVCLGRPGQYLARMPTCIASVIALFGASAAVQDLRGTSQLSEKERARHLETLGLRYGYGSHVGGDGRIHIGIEKVPFVRARKRGTWFERKMSTFRDRA